MNLASQNRTYIKSLLCIQLQYRLFHLSATRFNNLKPREFLNPLIECVSTCFCSNMGQYFRFGNTTHPIIGGWNGVGQYNIVYFDRKCPKPKLNIIIVTRVSTHLFYFLTAINQSPVALPKYNTNKPLWHLDVAKTQLYQ